MRCHIDTVRIYHQLSTPLVLNHSVPWKYFRKANVRDSHFFIRYKGLTCHFYAYRHTYGELWVTLSVPRLVRGSNLFPLDMENLDAVLYEQVNSILSEIVSVPVCDVATWEVSRVDLFLLHRIDPGQRQWYLGAYSRLFLGAYIPCQYKNTFYLNSVLKRHKAAGTVVRIYPKLQEIQDRDLKDLDKEFERYLELCDSLHDFLRLEFQFRRRVLRHFFNHAPSVTLADVMKEDFQRERINRMIERLGLHHQIISREHMREQLPLIFSKRPTLQRAKQYIRLVNGRGVYPATIKSQFTAGQIAYIRKRLYEHDLHCIVAEGGHDLAPVPLLR